MGYHLFLMARGETTREYINSHKFAKKERYRAYSQGNWLKNMIAVLCRPRSPGYYRFKGKYRPGDQRLGQHYSLRTRKNSQGLELDEVPPGSRGFQGPAALRGEVEHHRWRLATVSPFFGDDCIIGAHISEHNCILQASFVNLS